MLDDLTPREAAIARMMAVEGMTSKQIGRALGISYRTVEVYRARILNKLGLGGGRGIRGTVMLARRMALAEM